MKTQNYAQALYLAINETAEKDHDRVLDNFVRVLAQSGDLSLLDEIEQEYLKIERQAKGIKEVHVTTASDQNAKELIKDLNKIVGDKIEVKHTVDDGIVGGVVVRVDDTLIDASVKNSLNNLSQLIKGNK